MKIYHYTKIEGDGEYIILSEDDAFSVEESARPGYKLNAVYEFDGDPGTLPLDRALGSY